VSTDQAPQALEQAIAWAVRLASGTATDADRAACQAWRSSHAAHEQAWQQVQAVEAQFALPAGQAGLAHGVLRSAGPGPARGRRASLQRLLFLGPAALLLGSMAWRWAAPREQIALETAIGERRSTLLADGSRLHLAPDTLVQVDFTLLRRVVRLARGEIFIDTGSDPRSLAGRRSFWVETPLARFEALGTSFGVRHEKHPDTATRLYVTEGRVAIHVRALGGTAPGPLDAIVATSGETHVLHAGQHRPVRLPDEGLVPDAWTDGVLVARRMRLDAFVTELSRQTGMPMECADDVAALRVSGVFQLDGPDPSGRALAAIARTLPVRVERGQGAASGARSAMRLVKA
jgi:transmembrane sensor